MLRIIAKPPLASPAKRGPREDERQSEKGLAEGEDVPIDRG